MWQALRLWPHRPGNVLRARLLRDSRDEPWSPAERRAHRLFRGRRIPFVANHPVRTPSGLFYLDMALPELLLGFEIDGRAYHADQFVQDRLRDAALAGLGWQVVRFPAVEVMDNPDRFLTLVEGAIAARRRLWRG